MKKKIKQFISTKITPNLKKKKRSIWVEDNIIFEKEVGKQVATPQGNKHLGNNFTEKKQFIFIIFIVFTFIIIIGRLLYLQVIQGEIYFQIAENNREKKIPIVAERGQIFDRFDVQLTQNIPNFSLAIIPNKLPKEGEELDYVVSHLAKITNKEEANIREILDDFSSYRYESIVISENLDYETALSIQIEASDLPGIHIQRGSKRLYGPADYEDGLKSLSHILGYQGKLSKDDLDKLYDKGYIPSDYIGKTGLEKQYEKELRGTYGVTRVEVNAFGKEQSILSEAPPVPGEHLRLSIDIDIQKKLEELLQKGLKANKKTRGVAIAMDPNNGEILAMVNLPTFDSNDFSGGINFEKYQSYIDNTDNPLFNRAVSGSYASGSTVKPVIAAGALQEGIITPNTSVLSTGGISVDPWFFPDWLSGGHGNTDVRESLAWSVNTFYYYIGGGYKNFTGLGVEKITDYLRLFGLGSKTGVDLPAENDGFLPSREWKETVKGERWYIGDTYNISIGQGDILVTPLQIAGMTSAVANGGTLYKPHFLINTIDPLSKREEKMDVEIIRENVVDSENIETVRLGMRDCVVYGSCRRLASAPVQVAGKTGTAQWSNTKDPHAWFTSFAPFKNPQIVVTILVEEGDSGSSAAIPIADEFYRWWWLNKAI